MAFVDHAAVLGGGEIALCNLIELLDKRRWQPLTIVGGEGAFAQRLRRSGSPVDVLSFPSTLGHIRQDQIDVWSPVNPARAAAASSYVWRLARRFRRENAVLVHTNSLRACVVAGLAARLTGRPLIWQIHSVVSEPMMTPAAVRLIRWLARWLPDRIICNSRATASCFELAAERVRVIHCGLDPTRYHANGRASRPRRVGMIARFSPLKGQHIFVEAARRTSATYPDVEFVVAGSALFGEDAYARRVRDDAETLSRAGRVRFLGFVDDVPALLEDLDVVVQPSVHPEGFGQAILEAMMAGKPVIASAVGGMLDLVEDGRTGRLIPPGDADALATALEGMLRDPAGAAAMGDRGRERARERFDIRESARAIAGVYEEVLAG